MNRLRFLVCLLFCTLLAVPSAHAQQDPELEVGMKPFGAYNGGNIDTVSLFHGQLSLDIPLISYPQRGGRLKLDYHLRYANVGVQADYFKITIPPPGQGTITYYQAAPPSGWCGNSGMANYQLCHGFRVVDEQSLGDYVSNSTYTIGNYGYTDFSPMVTMPDGGAHAVFPTCGTCSPSIWESVDGTSFQLQCPGGGGCYYGYNVSPATIVDSEGVKYVFPTSGQAYRQDTNSNTITYSGSGVGLTDTMGRVIPSIPAPTSSVTGCPQPPSVPVAPSSAATWNPPGVNGGTYPIMFCYIQISETNPINYEYNGGPWVPYPYTGTELQSVVLPNGSSWTFEYTTDGNADLSEVIFPTGGTLSYGSWQNVAGRTTCNQCVDYNRAVGSRTLNPNDGVTPSSTWTYTYPSGGGTIVSSPPSSGSTPDDTVHTFAGPAPGYETQTQYYQGSHSTGVLLKTVNTQFSYLTIPWGGFNYLSAINIVPAQTTTAWANGQQNKTTYAYDSGVQIYKPEWVCAPCGFNGTALGNAIYGKVLTKREYDYGNPSPPASPLRTTMSTWLALNNSGYLSANLLDLPSSVQVTGSGPGSYTTYSYDESNGSPQGVLGNLTSVHRWLNTTNGYLVTNNVYNSNGLLTSSTDPKGNPTTYGYSGSFAGSGPTSVTNALGQTTNYTYDFNTGLLNSTTDPNTRTTSYQYDNMFRTTQISKPDGGQSTFGYPNPNEVDITEKISASANRLSSLLVDGVGRKIRQATTNGEPNKPYDEADTCYDGNGRVSFTSYPFQDSGPFATPRTCASPELGDSFAYDALSRTLSVSHSDANSVISTSYSGNTTTVTDEQARTRESVVDGLGRLTQMIENPGGLNYATNYTYDALDNLTSVVQNGSRNRSFLYDSLSRLTSSTNPESNWSPASLTSVATTYSYDADGNLVNKSEPAQNQQGTSLVTLTYCYDAVNRMTAKGYTAQACTNGTMPSPVATYFYDQSNCLGQTCYNVGRRTGMTDNNGSGSEAWAYDSMGRTLADQRTTSGITKSSVYQYNLLGSPTSIQYPSGRTINYAYNAGNRPTSATDTTSGLNYASSAHYAANGTQCWAVLGGVNTVSETLNSRLQPNQMQATKSVVGYSGSCPGLGQTGNLLDLSYNFNLGSGDNGNVMGIVNNRDTTRSQAFTYDLLNRLAQATASTYAVSPAHCWGEIYTYDNLSPGGAWGNLTAIGVVSSSYNGCTQESLSLSVDTNNRINSSGYGYDTAGNMIIAPPTGTTYTFNAENQMTQAVTATTIGYLYDGDGKRVAKTASGTPFKLYWYDLNGNVLDETDATGSTSNSNFNEYIFFGGKRIARRND